MAHYKDDYLTHAQFILANKLRENEAYITPDTELTTLTLDSLDRVELIMTFEDEYDIEIRDEDVERLKTVTDIAIYLEKRLGPVNPMK